jgi:hypothetical protein
MKLHIDALLIACAALFPALPTGAEIYRCVKPGGSVTYQELPCESGAQGGAVDIPSRFPDHIEPRERLAAREAAADARLLKRLEIEAAERIARDARISRENELAAERERALAAQPQTPIYVLLPVPRRPVPRLRPHAPTKHSLHLMR